MKIRSYLRNKGRKLINLLQYTIFVVYTVTVVIATQMAINKLLTILGA